jgi:protein involved in polysaccharide export with SLBB domain
VKSSRVLVGFCLLLFAGCASDPLAGQRMARYTPDVDGRTLHATSASTVDTSDADAAGPAKDVPAVPSAPRRTLEAGDTVAIYLRGIPNPEDIQDIVDDQGHISLSLLGPVRVAGRTTSEVERIIEDAYIQGGYYTKINIIVVSQEAQYFVRGEVKREGKYDLQGDMTLIQAIAAAGGYTRFANPRKISIIREDDILECDAVRIEDRKEEDPRIKPDDVVVVPKRRW